jgi:hypothetical protein
MNMQRSGRKPRLCQKGDEKMTIHELKERSKKAANISNEDYAVIEKLYILLDLHKDDFAKIVDAVGVEKLISRENYWDRLQTADNERQTRLKYEEAKNEMDALTERQRELQKYFESYTGTVKVL